MAAVTAAAPAEAAETAAVQTAATVNAAPRGGLPFAAPEVTSPAFSTTEMMSVGRSPKSFSKEFLGDIRQALKTSLPIVQCSIVPKVCLRACVRTCVRERVRE